MNTANNLDNNLSQQNQDEDNIDLSSILNQYRKNWKTFFLSFIIIISCSVIYLFVASPKYKISSLVLIKEEQNSTADMLTSSFSSLGFDVGVKNLDNEMAALQTRNLALKVSDSLNLRVSYFKKKGILKKVDLYKKSPAIIKLINFKNIETVEYNVDKIDDNTLSITNKDTNLKAQYGDIVKTNEGSFVLNKNITTDSSVSYPIILSIAPGSPLPKIEVESTAKRSSVLNISTTDTNPEKACDIINTLIFFYNEDAYTDKNLSARSTIDFIDSRLSIISGELENAEKSVEDYKKENKLTDLKADAEIYLQSNSEYDKKLSEITLNINVLSSIREYLEDNKHKNNIVPSNLGIQDATLLELMKTFNEAQLEKIKMTKGMKSENPILKNYEDETELLRKNLIENIKNVETGFKLAKNEVLKQENTFSSKISNLSTQEREYRELYRQQNIKETLYIFLLQKKEETGLYLTAVVPNAKIIDHAYIPDAPVSPKKSIILLVALVLSLIIPIIIIYVKSLLNYKVSSHDDLAKLSNIPYLGEIPINKEPLLEPNENGTIISEKFRTNCINLDFVLNGQKHKVIMTTSSLSGEGKTYYTTNLAIALSNMGNKVLLINLDLHKNDGYHLADAIKNNGISTYLIDSHKSIEDIISKSKNYQNLDIINNGPIPPNPAMLLISPKIKDIFDTVRDKYDYIVVDTPPIGLMADAMMLDRYADLTIYVIRQNYTPKKSLQNIQEIYKSKKLTNIHTILNGVDMKEVYGEYYDKNYNRYYGKNSKKK